MSAGLSGAMAARGVAPRRRGDDPGRQPGRVGAGDARLLPDGRGGAARATRSCARKDLELRVAAAEPGALHRRGALPRRAARRRPATSTWRRSRAILDEDERQEPPAEAVDLDPEDPAVIIFTSGTTGEPRGVVYPQRYLTGQRAPGRALVRRRGGRARLVHRGARLVEVHPQRLHRPVAARRGGADPRRPLRPRRALEIVEREGVNVLCQAPTEYRMLAKRTELRPDRRRCGGWSRPASRSTPR